jgi:LPXTG-motif cell wall-anchored protein
MFGRSLKVLAVSVAAGAGSLLLGAGAAHAIPNPIHPINPCIIDPSSCKPNPITLPPVHLDPCLIDPSICAPQPPQPPQPPTAQPTPSNGGSGTGASGGQGNGSVTQTGTGLPGPVALVHNGVPHTGDGSSSDGLVLAGGAAAVVAAAGLAGLFVWRRRRALA